MKKRVIGTMLAVSLFFGNAAFAGNTVANVDDSASATVAALPAVALKKHRIKEVRITSGTTEKAVFRCGATAKFSQILEANKPYTFTFADDEAQCAVNEAFNIIKTTAGSAYAGYIKYIDQN